jgi:hypothetical protein
MPDPPITLSSLEAAIRQSWSRDTSDDADEWSTANSSRGQCDVTALILRDFLGGDILIAPVIPREGTPRESHAWNRLTSGIELDLTRGQFRAGETFGPAEVREPRVATGNSERYHRLAGRVRQVLGIEDRRV